MCSSERVGKTKVGGTLLTEAKYINLSLHFLEQVRVKGIWENFTRAHKYMTFLDFLTIMPNANSFHAKIVHIVRSMEEVGPTS